MHNNAMVESKGGMLLKHNFTPLKCVFWGLRASRRKISVKGLLVGKGQGNIFKNVMHGRSENAGGIEEEEREGWEKAEHHSDKKGVKMKTKITKGKNNKKKKLGTKKLNGNGKKPQLYPFADVLWQSQATRWQHWWSYTEQTPVKKPNQERPAVCCKQHHCDWQNIEKTHCASQGQEVALMSENSMLKTKSACTSKPKA